MDRGGLRRSTATFPRQQCPPPGGSYLTGVRPPGEVYPARSRIVSVQAKQDADSSASGPAPGTSA